MMLPQGPLSIVWLDLFQGDQGPGDLGFSKGGE